MPLCAEVCRWVSDHPVVVVCSRIRPSSRPPQQWLRRWWSLDSRMVPRKLSKGGLWQRTESLCRSVAANSDCYLYIYIRTNPLQILILTISHYNLPNLNMYLPKINQFSPDVLEWSSPVDFCGKTPPQCRRQMWTTRRGCSPSSLFGPVQGPPRPGRRPSPSRTLG